MSHSTGQIEPRRLDNAKLLSWSSCSSLSKTYGCALLIIGVIGFAAAGMGLAAFGNIQGWWVAGSLSSLGQATAIALMVTGGSLTFLTVALATTINYVRNRGKGKQGVAGASPASSPKLPVIPTTVPTSAPTSESSTTSDSKEPEAVFPQGGIHSSAEEPSSPQPETLTYSRPLVLSTWQKIRLAKRKEALENGPFNTINPRQLALIHGDTFIRGEEAFEGASSDYVIGYERRRLESYRAILSSPDREYPFVDPDLSLDEIDNILLDFEDFRQAAAIQDSAKMIAFINGRLERRRRCVIPIRVMGREVGDPGHIFTCAITEDEKGEVYFHLMNKGEGSEMNPPLIGGSQQKVSYRYPSIRLKDRAILNPESDVGNSFFTRLQKFSTEKPPDDTKLYCSSEIYNLFLLIGEVDHTYRPLTSEESSISQWSGTCPGQLAKLLIRDNLHSQGSNRKKQDFAQRFDSLRDGVKSIDLKPPENRALLEKVLHGFCNLVEKSYPSLISEDELVSALALIEWGDEKLQRAKSEAIQKREFSLEQQLLPTSFEVGEIALASISQSSALNKSGASGAARPAHVPQPSLNPPENVTDLKRLLEEQWIPYLDHLKGLEKARFVFLALQGLPVPTRTADAFWDKIPQEKIGPLVENISVFAKKGLQILWDAHKSEKERDNAHHSDERAAGYDAIINHYQLGITLATLTHVFKLCTQIPELHLGEYSLPINQLAIVRGSANWDVVISELGDCYPGDREVVQHDGSSAATYLSLPSADRRDRFEKYVQFFKCEDESKYLWPKRLIGLPGRDVEKSFMRDVYSRQQGQSNLNWDSLLDYLQSLFPKFETELEGANSTALKCYNLWKKVLPASFPPFATLREFMEQFVFSGDSASNISLLELHRWDPEFEQSHSLLKSFHEEVGTENAMSRESGKPFAGSNAVAQELRKAQIASRPSIRVAFLLNWMRENSTRLEYKGVQQEIMARLLKRGIIPEAFAEEPSLRRELIAFIDAKLDSYFRAPRLIETAFFLTRLRYRIESCASMDPAKVEEVAARLREGISGHYLPSLQTRLHILYFQSHRASLTAEEWGEVVEGFLEVKNRSIEGNIENSLFNEISLFFCKNQEALHRELGPHRDIWEPILRRVAKSRGFKFEEIEGSFPLFHLGQLSINLSTGEIDSPRTQTFFSFGEVINSDERSSGSSGLADANLQQLENQCRGRKWFSENKSSYESVLKKIFSADDLFRFHKGSYVSPSEGNDPGEKTMSLLLDARESEPVCLVIYDEDETEVFKLNKKGELTGDKLVSEPAKIDQLKSLVNMFSTTHLRPWLWQNQATGQVTVEWPQLGLTFITQDDGKLFCQQLPGFYVATDQHIAELYPFQNGVILTNAQNEEKVLLPRLDLFEKSRIFQGEAEGDKLEETKEIGEGQTYFVYNRRAVRGHLHSSSVQEMVYLMVVNVIQGNYEEATWILNQLGDDESAKVFELDTFKKFLNFDRTKLDPCRSSFYLKWCLRIKEISALYPGGRQKEGELPEFVLLQHHNSFYHRLQSLHGVCRLPYYLVLSKEESRRIESTLGKVATRGEAASESAFFTFVNSFFFLNPSDGNLKKVRFPHLTETKDSIRLQQEGGSWTFSQAYEYFRTLKKDVPIIEMDFSALLFSGYDTKFLKLLYIVAISDPENFPPFPKDLIGWENGYYDRGRDVEPFLKGVFEKASEKWKTLPREKIKAGPAVKVGESPSWDKPPYEELHHDDAADYSPSSEVGDRAFPLQTLFTDSLVPSAEATIENGEFALSRMEGSLSTDLAKALHERLSAAHVNSQKISRYSIPDRGALEGEIEGLIERQNSAAQLLRERIEKRANRTPLDEEGEVDSAAWKKAIHEQVRLLGKKRAHLTMNNHLYTAFLSQNPQLLREHNPFLSEAEVKGIFQMIADYMVICSRVDQAREAQRSLKSGQDSDQEIGEILHKRRSYDHNEFPALLVYEYATGMILRPEQAELLKKIFSAQNISHCQELLVEFQAGGGKTKVISAILSYLAKEKGKLPVFFSLPALHDITKVDLSESLSQVFNQRLKVLHLKLHGQYSDSYLRDISRMIKEWKEDGCSVQMVPESWHTLNLTYQFALREKAEERIAICQDILKFFYENGYFIIDEAHRNVQSLWQANISTGRPISFEKDEKRLFVLCYRALTGHTRTHLKLKDGRSLHEVLKLEKNGQALATDAEKEEILSLLADYLLKKLKVAEERRDEIRQYLLHESIPMPPCVEQLYENGDRRKAELLFLSRGLLSQVLTPVLGMVHMFDYGGSVRDGEEIEDPRFQRNPSLSQYENPDIAATLCNQGLYQRGLSEPQMKKLLKMLYVEHKQSPEIVRDPTKTPQALLFMEWQRKVGVAEPVSIEEDPAENAQLLEELCKKMGHTSEVIEKYLVDILLPQIKIYPEKVSSTAVDLVEGGAEVILLSATLGLAEEYPERESVHAEEDTVFQVAVIQRGCAPQNREMHWLTPSTPKQLFVDLYQENPVLMDDLEGIIDIGGWNRDYSTAEVAHDFLDFITEKKLPIDGVVYITEDSSSLTEKSELVVLLKDGNGGKTKRLKGSNLNKALKENGLTGLRLFKIYGPSQCTGTDLQLAKDGRMLVTLGETITLWPLIQAIMRARAFIKAESEQKLVWVGSNALKPLIPNVESGPEALYIWALQKEADRMHRGIMARAFQSISGAVRGYVKREKLLKADVSQEQIEIFDQHAKAFAEELGRNLFALYAEAEEQVDVELILTSFAQSYRAGVQLSEEEWKASHCEKKVKRIIAQTKKLIRTAPSKSVTPSLSVGYQHAVNEDEAEAKTEKEVENRMQKTSVGAFGMIRNWREEEYVVTEYAIDSADLTKDVSEVRVSANGYCRVAGCFSKDLYLLTNARKTVGVEDPHFKKLNFWLLILENEGEVERKYAYAVSIWDATNYFDQLQAGRGIAGRRVALMTSDGIVVCNGQGEKGVSAEKLAELRNSLWMQKILSDLAFLNGRVHDIVFLEKQIAYWQQILCQKSFMEMWKSIQDMQLTPDGMHESAINELAARKQYIFSREECEEMDRLTKT